MLQDILKRFEETKFAKGGGACFECCDYEGMYVDLKAFLTFAISEAQREIVPEKITTDSECNHQPLMPQGCGVCKDVRSYNQAIDDINSNIDKFNV